MRASVKNPDGMLISTSLDSDREEQCDTVQCVHCGAHWLWKRAVIEAIDGGLGFCQRCNGITCGKECEVCVPSEQQLENLEAGRPDYRTYRPIRVALPGKQIWQPSNTSTK